jgi:hypothetical protein
VIWATGLFVFGDGIACRTLVGGSQPFLLVVTLSGLVANRQMRASPAPSPGRPAAGAVGRPRGGSRFHSTWAYGADRTEHLSRRASGQMGTARRCLTRPQRTPIRNGVGRGNWIIGLCGQLLYPARVAATAIAGASIVGS